MHAFLIPAIVVGTTLTFVLIGVLRAERKVADLRAVGIYPEEGTETDADVSLLLARGEKIMAIRCYRTIHKVGLKEAKAAVESLNAG